MTAKSKTDKQIVRAVVARWAQWQWLYGEDYILRFFHLYNDELLPVLRTLKKYANRD